MGGSSKKSTIGYRYSLGEHMILCHGPVDFLSRISAAGKTLWNGATRSAQIAINKENLFGGEKREGGISGLLDYEEGSPNQGRNTYLQSRLGASIPAFRGVVGVVLRQMYLGMSPYLKPWSFKLQRVLVRQDGIEQWYVSKAPIGAYVPSAIHFALDASGSMGLEVAPGVTRLDVLKEAMRNVLDTFDTLTADPNFRMDIEITAFGSHPDTKQNTVRRNITSLSVSELKSFVNALTPIYNTYFPAGVSSAPPFFSASDPSLKRIIVFVTDGEPSDSGAPINDPTVIATDARNLIDSVEGVISYGINIDLPNTTYTQIVDNSGRSVPVVQDNNPGSLTAIILGVIAGQVDLNPAHLIRECLTDPDWGMGYAESDMDDSSFTAAADTLFDENMGISLLWNRQTPIESFVSEIVKHIDAALFVGRASGKFELKLVRDDYDPGGLITLDDGNIIKTQNLQRTTFGELTNSVTVNYWDAQTEKTASVSVQDTAQVQMQGSVINTAVQYPGFTNADIASRVAMRDLLTLSTPLWTGTLLVNLDAEELMIGDPFKLTWPKYGINEVVMRVTGIAYGNGLTNRVRIQATQDVFAIREGSVLGVPAPEDGWIPLNETAQPLPVRVTEETPYYELVRQLGQTEIDSLLNDNPQLGYTLIAGSRPSSEGALNALVFVDSGSGYVESDTLDFAPVAYLDGDATKTQTVIPIKDGEDLDLVVVGQYAQIGTELVRVDAISINSVTLGRALLDTVPAAPNDGDAILFWDGYPASDEVEYVESESVNVKLRTVTGAETLSEADAPVDAIAFGSRAIRPYRPANLQLDGQYEEDAQFFGTGTLTWNDRDRAQETSGTLTDFYDSGNIGPEAGINYQVEIDVDTVGGYLTDWLVVDVGPAKTYFFDSGVNPLPIGTTHLIFRVATYKGSLRSFTAPEIRVTTLTKPINLSAIYRDLRPPINLNAFPI